MVQRGQQRKTVKEKAGVRKWKPTEYSGGQTAKKRHGWGKEEQGERPNHYGVRAEIGHCTARHSEERFPEPNVTSGVLRTGDWKVWPKRGPKRAISGKTGRGASRGEPGRPCTRGKRSTRDSIPLSNLTGNGAPRYW